MYSIEYSIAMYSIEYMACNLFDTIELRDYLSPQDWELNTDKIFHIIIQWYI